MREIASGNPNSRILAVDEPGQGGANHVYVVFPQPSDSGVLPFADVAFQNGPVKEHGVNGCHQEDLLAIVIDRLRCFQAGPFACRENALALTKCEEAIHWLEHRTRQRQLRGVEGTNRK